MPEYQSKNKKTGAYFKYDLYDGMSKITDVKQREPGKPFKGIPIRKGR